MAYVPSHLRDDLRTIAVTSCPLTLSSPDSGTAKVLSESSQSWGTETLTVSNSWPTLHWSSSAGSNPTDVNREPVYQQPDAESFPVLSRWIDPSRHSNLAVPHPANPLPEASARTGHFFESQNALVDGWNTVYSVPVHHVSSAEQVANLLRRRFELQFVPDSLLSRCEQTAQTDQNGMRCTFGGSETPLGEFLAVNDLAILEIFGE